MAALERPVILLEGARRLQPADRPSLVALAELMAKRLPSAVFRTGGAEGADDACAEGVCRVAPRRLERVLPPVEPSSGSAAHRFAGLFVNAVNPFAGGTGPTIRVYRAASIPVQFQSHWRK